MNTPLTARCQLSTSWHRSVEQKRDTEGHNTFQHVNKSGHMRQDIKALMSMRHDSLSAVKHAGV